MQIVHVPVIMRRFPTCHGRSSQDLQLPRPPSVLCNVLNGHIIMRRFCAVYQFFHAITKGRQAQFRFSDCVASSFNGPMFT